MDAVRATLLDRGSDRRRLCDPQIQTQSIPDRPDQRGHVRSSSLRVRDSAYSEIFPPAGILLQLPVAAEDGLPHAGNHFSVAASIHSLQLPGIAAVGSTSGSL